MQDGGFSLTPPSPPILPPNVNQEVVALAPWEHSIMVRPCGSGTTGRRIPLSTNHLKESLSEEFNVVIYQYCVRITYEDKRPVEGMGLRRKLVDMLYQTYSSELGGKKFAYDGEKALYTVGPLPRNKLEFTVLDESFAESETGKSRETNKMMKRCSNRSKSFNVEISYAAKIPLKSIALALQEAEVDNPQDALRVLDIMLRQKAAKMGCLRVRQSFFHDDSRNFVEIGGGVTGIHSSFHPTQGGLSLNMDVSTTMIVTPESVIDFLLTNQGVKEPCFIDWEKVKRLLKNMRITTRHGNMECKIAGLSKKTYANQDLTLKLRSHDDTSEGETGEITVYEYFVKHCGIELTCSAHIPCLDLGKPKRPTYDPIELCSLVSLQRYTKALSSQQRASLVEKSIDAIINYRDDKDLLLAECDMFIEKQLIQMDGRILETPKLIEHPLMLLEEEPQSRRQSPVIRVEKMFEQVKTASRLSIDRGPWKTKSLCYFETVRQCISPSKINDQYLTNVLLKINTKLGDINSLLALEHSSHVPLIQDSHTMILDMDVSHGSPGRSDIPSVAVVVGSQSWPLISRYSTAVGTHTAKVEMIALDQPLENGKDDGIVRNAILIPIEEEKQRVHESKFSPYGLPYSVDYDTLGMWDKYKGTTNLAVKIFEVEKKIILGTDSRLTHEGSIKTDGQQKFEAITPRIVATMVGSAGGCDKIWKRMKEFCTLEGTEPKTIKSISEFGSKIPRKDDDKTSSECFVIGIENDTPTIYHLTDLYDEEESKSRVQNSVEVPYTIAALGSGREDARDAWNEELKRRSPPLDGDEAFELVCPPLDEAFELVLYGLLAAALTKIDTGGILRVIQLSSAGVEKEVNKTTVELYLQFYERYRLLESKSFFLFYIPNIRKKDLRQWLRKSGAIKDFGHPLTALGGRYYAHRVLFQDDVTSTHLGADRIKSKFPNFTTLPADAFRVINIAGKKVFVARQSEQLLRSLILAAE